MGKYKYHYYNVSYANGVVCQLRLSSIDKFPVVCVIGLERDYIYYIQLAAFIKKLGLA